MNSQNPAPTIESLFDAHGRALLAQVYGILGDYHATQDVVQETFLKFHRLQKRKKVVRHPYGWLHRVASNAAINALRDRSHRAESMNIAWEAFELPAVEPSDRAESAELAAALSKLQAREREILELRVLDGLSFREMGELFGCTENAARKHYDRVRERMQKLLAQPVSASAFERTGVEITAGP